MNLRNSLIAALAFLAMLLAAPSFANALENTFTVTAAKKADGAYKSGFQSATIDTGKSKLFFWNVDSNAPEDMTMSFDDAATGSSGAEGYKIKWFKGKKPKASRNVSSAVKDDAGYEFTLKSNKRKYFTAKVTAKPGAEVLCLGGQALNHPTTFTDSAYFFVNGECT